MISPTVSIAILIISVQIVLLDTLIPLQEYANLTVMSPTAKVVIYPINAKHVKLAMILSTRPRVLLKAVLQE